MTDPFEAARDRQASPRDVDFYAVLGVANPEGWTDKALASLYRRACREHHPDRHPEGREHARHFQRLQEAYAVIGDPRRRAVYDRWLGSGLTKLVSWEQWEGRPTVSHWRAEVREPRALEGAEQPEGATRQTPWEEMAGQEEELRRRFKNYQL